MPEGLIVKALSGYYYVLPDEGGVTIQCRARGIFKNRGESPLVGDRVLYDLTENGEGMVQELYPRSTELIRPPIANVKQAILVFSLAEPALNLQLLDKFLVHTEYAGLTNVICMTKLDLLDDSDAKIREEGRKAAKAIELYKQIGYQVITTSSRQDVGIVEVRDALANTISVFSGQSGVGKSTMINRIVPGLKLETNEISMKLGRGKHTTRHVELIHLENGGVVADTPGFSQLDFLNMEPEELGSCFIEFTKYAPQCKFRGCLHQNEPKCAVIQATEKGEIAQSRHEHYLQFLVEMKDRKRRY
ncbi:GTPase RsgA [Paenibacillus swuensis]|uniref:Small ribosomal subunit biogenesis GTPase RsgA n=1 Tax=Paenibacillus swuensis TaxID=1178515 RepID=A0A172TKN4_9BACL|nr:ribosome small subunit-dependent GTPase A [Paenibacillus swuensis]ANE47484.1 GTPase RsgA [Paenibacillus swuensis]